MADNVTILDSAEVEQTIATHDLGSGVHASKIVQVDTNGNEMGYSDDEIAIPAAITEDIFHYAVHDGLAFGASTYHASQSQYICFTTPNIETYFHVLWSIASEGNCRLDIYEGVTAGGGGSDQAVFNKNRAAAFPNGGGASLVRAGNTATVGSVQVGIDWTGGTHINPQGFYCSKGAVRDNASDEFVLEKNTTYGFHLVAIDSKDLGMTITWFEIPNA